MGGLRQSQDVVNTAGILPGIFLLEVLPQKVRMYESHDLKIFFLKLEDLHITMKRAEKQRST